MLTKTQITELNFNGETIYVGIDTHKKNWKVALYHNETALKVFTQDAKPELLIGYLKKHYPGASYQCAYEAGFCGFWIQKHLAKNGINCIVVNPADVPTSHKEKEFKSDPRDCRKIARSLRSNLLEPIYIPTDEGLEARNVVRFYNDMTKNYCRQKNKVKAIISFYGIEYPQEFSNTNSHWSTNFYKWLEGLTLKSENGTWTLQAHVQECLKAKEQKKIATRKVRSLSKSEQYNYLSTLLRTIPGIGLITSMIILTEIENINRFKKLDEFCSYIGLVPSTNSSGDKERIGEITHRGNKFLKGIIIESAWMALRQDTRLFHTFIALKQRMEGNKAIIRIARKLAARIMYVLVNEKPYVMN